MSWSILLKAAVAAVIVSAAASLLGTALLMAGLSLPTVRVAMLAAAAVAAAAVSGVASVNALRAGAELLRARLHGVVGVSAAGLFAGLIGFGDAGIAIGVGTGTGAAGWVGARVATTHALRHTRRPPTDPAE